MEHLDYFIAIAEEQNLSRAARRLYISQPALTRFVNNLEEQYGVKLFDRSKSPISLTAAGQIFLKEKIHMDSMEQDLRRRLSEVSSGSEHITIGTGHNRCTGIIPELISRITADNANISFSVKCRGERELPNMLQKRQADLIYGIFDSVDGMDVEWRLAASVKLSLLAPVSFGLLPPDVSPADTFYKPYMLKPEQLNGLPMIVPSNSLGSSINHQLMLNQFAIHPSRIIYSENASLTRQLILRG